MGLSKTSALTQTQKNGVISLNEGLTKNSEIYVHVQPRIEFQCTFADRQYQTGQSGSPQNRVASDHWTLSTQSHLEALEPRLNADHWHSSPLSLEVT